MRINSKGPVIVWKYWQTCWETGSASAWEEAGSIAECGYVSLRF